MKSLVDLDLNQNKLQNAVIGGGTAAPSNPVEGQIYFNTSSDTAFIYDGSDWVPLSEGGVTGVKGNSESTYRTGDVNITAANVGAVPTTRTVNSKALSADITLTASDVGAAPTSHASSATTYGAGTSSNYGHVKLSDATDGTAAAASGGTAATPKAVKDALQAAKDYADGLDTGVSDVKVDGTSVVTDGVASVALVGAQDTVGVVKNGSLVTSPVGFIPSPIINGVPYYQNSTYTAATTASAVSTTASGGSASTYSKGDHVHSISLDTGDNNGQVKIAGTNVSVKGLGGAAYKSIDQSITSQQSTNLPTSAAVVSLVSTAIGAVDAMRFKGTVGTASGATTASLPTSGVKRGDTYRVVTLSSHPTIPWSSIGVGEGPTLENGDIVIALIDSATRASSDWTVAQTNIDGAVTASTTTTNGYLAKFTGDKIVANGPQLGSSTTTFLRNDGTWATPAGTAPTYTSFTGNPTANATPGFGDTVTVSQISQSTTGQVSGTDRTITIPSATATNSTAGLMSAEDKATLQYISQSVTGLPIAYGGEATLTAGQTSTTIPLSLRIGTETILCQPLTLSAYDNNGNQIMVNVVKHNSGSTYDFTVSIPTAVSYDITLRYTYSKALQ